MCYEQSRIQRGTNSKPKSPDTQSQDPGSVARSLRTLTLTDRVTPARAFARACRLPASARRVPGSGRAPSHISACAHRPGSRNHSAHSVPSPSASPERSAMHSPGTAARPRPAPAPIACHWMLCSIHTRHHFAPPCIARSSTGSLSGAMRGLVREVRDVGQLALHGWH